MAELSVSRTHEVHGNAKRLLILEFPRMGASFWGLQN